MAQTKIIIDTNSYLRLGKSISPLLGKPFGEENLTLYAHDYLEDELNRSDRLISKFSWFSDKQYVTERKKRIPKSNEQKDNIEDTFNHLHAFEKNNDLSLSLEDKYCLSVAFELKITCVTDEIAMLSVAKEFDINIVTTLGLMKIMVENKFITLQKVRDIIDYLKYLNDLPYKKTKVLNEFKFLFNEDF